GDLAERIQYPLVENACRYGRSRARVSIARSGSKIEFTVEDDGPGVADAEIETIFEPGVRGEAAGANGHGVGAGLGLALARRLARGAAGEISVSPSREGGHFVVSLPAA